ncbi:MAG: hypothetical protein ACI8VE_001201, partial [Natrialbaceae archaeon]
PPLRFTYGDEAQNIDALGSWSWPEHIMCSNL